MKKNLKSKKANTFMGQHFLRSQGVITQIVDAAEVTKKDTVLEVGPGKGILTEELARRAKKVVAVEKDPRLVEFLKDKFSSQKNIEIISGDILKINLARALPLRFVIVANLPYYLTSRFLRIFLDSGHHTSIGRPVSITVMVQREVAKRIVARPPQMNLLALSVQAYGKPKIIGSVSRELFHPRPNVDSAIITISDIGDSFFKKNKISEKIFFETAKKAFGQKRKMLRNSIGVASQKRLPSHGFDKARPQELSLEDWVRYTKIRA